MGAVTERVENWCIIRGDLQIDITSANQADLTDEGDETVLPSERKGE